MKEAVERKLVLQGKKAYQARSECSFGVTGRQLELQTALRSEMKNDDETS